MDGLIMMAGLALAVFGAHILVDGSVVLARTLRIPPLVVGATVVGFGTSMPEFTVNFHSALNGNTDLAIGNILGSNIFNICIIIGVCCLVRPLAVDSQSAGKHLPMCLISAALVGVCGNELYFDGINYHELMVSDGIVFLIFFAIVLYYIIADARADRSSPEQMVNGSGMLVMALPKIIAGLALLAWGGDLIVEGAEDLAKSYGMPDRLIGLWIVGPGTSLPELIASLVAVFKRQTGMVIGNVLGSNLFNVFFTLGLTSLIMPVPLDLELNRAVLMNVGVTLVLGILVWGLRKRLLSRGVGVFLILVYPGYLLVA
ncbi:MAG: calcium/sodium antiporter [Endozoicomonas sp.]